MSFELRDPEEDLKLETPPPKPKPKKKAEQVEKPKKLPKDSNPLFDVKPEGLPSQGKSYPEGLEITYTPYSFGQVKRASSSNVNIKTEYELILEGVTCSDGFDKYKLTFMDVYYLGFLRKIASFGQGDIQVRYDCAECGEPGDHVFNNTDLEFFDLGAKSLPIKAKLSDGEYTFSPMTIEQYFFLFRKDKHLDELAKLAMECSSHDFETAYARFDKAEGFDAEVLELVDTNLFHGVKPLVFRCKNQIFSETCNNEIAVNVEGGGDLVRPFRGPTESPESAISFG